MGKLSIKGLALAAGLLWGGMLLLVGLGATGLGVTDGSYYGKDLLLAVASIYPGYSGTPGLGNTLIGTAYGFVDGCIGGALLAWLYNLCAGGGATQASNPS